MNPDFREIGESVDKRPVPDQDSFWIKTWNERGLAVTGLLGETLPPGMVTSYSWKEYVLPGACSMTFECRSTTDEHLHMTLGLTQPVDEEDETYPWEFAVRTRGNQEWAPDLLYQLLTQWHWDKGEVWFGNHFPLLFFTDRENKLWAGMTDELPELKVVGSIRGLYLWTDESQINFQVSTGDFGLLTVIGVTEDEIRLADETTPAHLMLLLRRMGIPQICDPYRRSVMSIPGASEEWDRIKDMLHDDAFDELRNLS